MWFTRRVSITGDDHAFEDRSWLDSALPREVDAVSLSLSHEPPALGCPLCTRPNPGESVPGRRVSSAREVCPRSSAPDRRGWRLTERDVESSNDIPARPPATPRCTTRRLVRRDGITDHARPRSPSHGRSGRPRAPTRHLADTPDSSRPLGVDSAGRGPGHRRWTGSSGPTSDAVPYPPRRGTAPTRETCSSPAVSPPWNARPDHYPDTVDSL